MRINDIVKHKNGEIIKITNIDCRNSEKTTIVYIRGLIYPLYNKNIFCSIEDIAEEYYPTEQELLEQCKKYIDTTKEYVRCAKCGDLHKKDTTTRNNKRYCDTCRETRFLTCNVCGHTEVIGYDEDSSCLLEDYYICPDCYKKRRKGGDL